MLIVQSGEGLECEVGRESVVEALLSELVPACIDKSHRDIVVRVQTRKLAPEEKLLEVGLLRVVEQLLEREL